MAKTEDLINAVLTQAKLVNGRKELACAEAFKLAQQFQVEIIDVGRICNQQNVKICKCQLGCFP